MRFGKMTLGLGFWLGAALACGGCGHNVLNHRPTIGTCPPSPGPPGPDAATASCASASDCSDAGPRFCVGGHCAEDECTSDTNCGATGICSCGFVGSGTAGVVVPNTCMMGEGCQTDAQCPSGYCSPSLDSIFIGGLSGGTNYSYSYHCHVSADTCTNDSDCGPQTTPTMPHTPVCMWNAQLGHFACGTPSVAAG
jgi:hypothetical protein